MEFIANDIIWEDLDELEIVEFGIPRRIYDRTDHFHNLDDFTFFKKFRLCKESVMQFLPYIENQLEFETDMNMSVSPINQLLTCLRLYATGAHLDCIADFIGIHPTTAGRIIKKVTRSIATLYDQFIMIPDNERRNILKRQFYDIARFPHVVGAIDCTHVKIQSPGGDDAEIFRNRKGYFSINVRAICNANLQFENVVGRWPGSAHDSTIFNSSRVAMLFENGQFDDCILLGDSGYPIKKYLLTPLLNPTSRAEQLYNEAHIRTRNTIERCFGIWKRRFPILAYGCRLKIETTMAIIIATAILHNFARGLGESEPAIDEEFEVGELNQLIRDGNIPNVSESTATANIILFRTRLIQDYFGNL